MCYSAKQNLRSLAKRFGVDVDWALFEQVFHRRLQDDEIKFARALKANFLRLPVMGSAIDTAFRQSSLAVGQWRRHD
jgi:hypothetical protein